MTDGQNAGGARSANTIEQKLRKQIRVQWVFMALLLAGLVIAWISLQQRIKLPIGGPMFREPIDDVKGKDNVKKFREITFWTKKGNGVWYDTADLRFYIDSVYPKLLDAQRAYMKDHPPTIDITGYEWKVGFYWMLSKDEEDDKTKADFCVVPILVKKGADPKKRKDVIDYFDEKLPDFYNHLPRIRVGRRPNGQLYLMEGEESVGGAYNTGTMFP